MTLSYKSIKKSLEIGFLFGGVILVWYGAIYVAVHSKIPADAKMGDMAQLLFGAAAFATFIMSILFTVAAIVGWQKISDIITEQVRKSFDREREMYDQEIKGRHYSSLGHLAFAFAYDPVKSKVVSDERLVDAIRYFRYAVREFPAGKDYYLTILNNLVYSCCMRNARGDRDLVLASTEKLLTKGQEMGRRFMVLTACRAIFQYSEDPRQIRMAKELLREMHSNNHEGVLESEKGEASAHLDWLRLNRPEL